MKNKQLTQIVKDKNKLKLINWYDYIAPTLANIFSVIFSTSIIFELKGVLNGYVLILLSVFIILFLIQNEIIKVKEIRKVFSGNKNALLPFSITFIISISLATIGMYFYTNKSMEIKDLSNVNKSIELNAIGVKYQNQRNKVLTNTYEATEDFKYLNNELKYWKRANAASIEERQDIRSKVNGLQLQINNNKLGFERVKLNQLNNIQTLIASEKSIINAKYINKVNKTKTNDFITYIFLTLILITEFSTIVLNKNIVEKRNIGEQFTNSRFAKTYLIASNLLTSMYMSAKDNWVNINNAKYSYANKDNILEWDEIKTIYNNFISLGILGNGKVVKESDDEKGLLHNQLMLSEYEAQLKLDQYFEKFFNIL
jgi:hypothetical protein